MSKPVGYFLIFILITIFVPFGFFVIFTGLPRQSLLECQRIESQTIDCTLKSSISGITVNQKTIKALKSVKINTHQYEAEGGTYTTYKIILSTQSGETVFSAQSDETIFGYHQAINTPRDEAEVKIIASQIQTFLLNTSEPSLTLQDNFTYWYAIFFGLIWQGTMLVMLLVFKSLLR